MGPGRERAGFELLHAPADGAGSLRVLLVGHAGERRFFERDGIYDDPATGTGYPDNAERFLFFSRAALEGLKSLGQRVDMLHAHDQQAAWTPCLVRTHEARAAVFRDTATVFTIHNLGYQGIYDPWVLGLAGFPRAPVPRRQPVRVLGPGELHEGRPGLRRPALDREPALRPGDAAGRTSTASGSRACCAGAARTCAAS